MSTETLEEASVEEPAAGTFEFDDDFQRKIVGLTVRDSVFAQRTDGLVRPEFFPNAADQHLIKIANDFFATYRKSPDPATLKHLVKEAIMKRVIPATMIREVNQRLLECAGCKIGDRDFIIDKVAEFAREQAVQNAMMESVKALHKKDYAKIEKLMRQALDVGAHEAEPEYDYLAEIDNRTAERVAIATGTMRPDGITTGIEDIDKLLLHHGWGRKELSCIMGRAKFGKSMALGDFGQFAWLAGYNVLCVTLEVSAKIYSSRIDANIADTAVKLLKDSPFEVQKRVKAAGAKAGGHFKMREFASGTFKPSHLRRMLEKYRHEGIIFDLIIVDYADIMAPDHYTGELRVDSMNIWLALRAIAFEQGAAVLTATQTNREGAKAMTAKATDVAEDYNKIRIADLVITGNATEAEIAAGEARLYFAASRNTESEITVRIKQDRAKMKFLKKVLDISR